MNGIINQRFVVAFYSLDGGHCDSEFLPKRQEAIDYAKRFLQRNYEKHKEILYAEITNYMKPNDQPIRIDL